jgi:hypothetical protein
MLGGDAVEAAALERPRAHGTQDFEVVVHALIVGVVPPRRHGQMARFDRPVDPGRSDA